MQKVSEIHLLFELFVSVDCSAPLAFVLWTLPRIKYLRAQFVFACALQFKMTDMT